MPVTTIGNLLETVTNFEQRAQAFYAEVRDKSPNNNVRLLAYYLSRQRRRLPAVMEDCEPEICDEIRNIVFEEEVRIEPSEQFFVIETPAGEVKGENLLAAAQNYSAALLNLYELIITMTDDDAAREMFESLSKTEKQDVAMMKKMQAMHYF